jgi:acyl-CoA dehydrogenase
MPFRLSRTMNTPNCRTSVYANAAECMDFELTDMNVAKRHQGVSLFWVPAKSPGIKITPLPKLGEPGRAWYMLLPTLNNERA